MNFSKTITLKSFAVRLSLLSACIAAVIFCLLSGFSRPWAIAGENGTILLGLDADISSGSAESGMAIQRGIELAIADVNAEGGVLGKPLALVMRDHRGNPARGIDNIIELAAMPNLVAVVGGLHTPVALAELETIHRHQVVYLGPWAAGTAVVDNGYHPNFVFRVSVRDQYAGGFLIEQAQRRGFKRPALLLENTSWGRSNEKAMRAALAKTGNAPATIQWFNWGVTSIDSQFDSIAESGADVIMLVANSPEGVVVANEMAAQPKTARLPIVSHWGVTGGSFYRKTRHILPQLDFTFLQTITLLPPIKRKKAQKLAQAYIRRYADCHAIEDIRSPAGTAHAYDLVRILALAVEKAGTTDRRAVRDAMEKIPHYEGVVRTYAPPFTAERHDALTIQDFHMARYDDNGVIRRVDAP